MQRHRMTPECRGGRRYGKIKMGEIWRGVGGGVGGGGVSFCDRLVPFLISYFLSMF